ncbi:MAG: hypothetical protein JO006_01630 [Paucibacter sp.]|nr:hypothetical protein [Roseateles sp.]
MQRLVAPLLLLATAAAGAQAQSTVYRCPGPPVLYTDGLSAKEAAEKGCRTVEGTPITIVQMPKRPSSGALEAQRESNKIEAGQQKARDDERRKVLEGELRDSERKLAEAQAEYNGGNGERRGDEARNYQKFLDRMADLKASINRQEADIQALKREISKLP